MPSGTGVYKTATLEITFTGNAIECDYGVPGSPHWIEWEADGVSAFAVLDVEVPLFEDLEIALITEYGSRAEFEPDP